MDHQLVGEKLKSIVTEAGLPFRDSLNVQFHQELDVLKAMSGRAFDASYLRDMEAIHAEDGAAFAKKVKAGSNAKLRAFAAETTASSCVI